MGDKLTVVALGDLHLPSGALGACDPYVFLDGCPAVLQLPPGRYPVALSLAEWTPAEGADPELVEAYLSVLVDPTADEVRQEPLDAQVGVDAGTVCFVDASSARRAHDVFADWEAVVQGPGGWFERMDDPAHLGGGRANVLLPGLDDGSNLVMCHSGFGDGIYPVVAGYDATGRVVRVHIDLGVIGADSPEAPSEAPPASTVTERTRAYALALMLAGSAALIGSGLALGWSVEAVVFGNLAWTAVAFGVSLYLGWTRL